MSAPAIELHRVGRQLGGAAVLDGIDLAVEAGELVLVTGRSGAGKTTLLRLLAAADPPDSGSVRLFGRAVARLRGSSLPALRRRIGVVFQDLKLFPDLSALANVALALEVHALPRREVRVRAAEALAAVGLACRVDAPLCALSIGEHQRVAIARALVPAPPILLADEPTAHLDPEAAGELLPLFRAHAAAGGAVVMTTNDRDVVAAALRAGARHFVLDNGQLRGAGLGDQVGGADAPNVVPLRRAAGGVE